MRCDRGDVPTDHHTLFLIGNGKGFQFNHAAFEVANMDEEIDNLRKRVKNDSFHARVCPIC